MRLNIDNYPVFVRVGYFDHERLHGQEVLISLQMNLPGTAKSFASDALDKTVDYGSVIQEIDRCLRYQEAKLVETLLGRLGEHLLACFPLADNIDLKIEKRVLPGHIGRGGKVSLSHLFQRETL